MIRPSLFAVVAGMALVSAAPPGEKPVSAGASSAYPPCSATVTDRCIQTYERGVRTAAAAPAPKPAKVPQGGPIEAASTAIMSPDDYPVCSRSVTDRCVQRGASVSAPRARPAPVRYARSVRQAGERG